VHDVDERFLRQRERMFHPASGTWWGRHRIDLCDLEEISNFPESAYYDDPNGIVDIRVALLKRIYLQRLRTRLLKIYRQGTSVYNVSRKYYEQQNKKRVENWIAWNKAHYDGHYD